MKDRIVQRARELGFDACRITTATPPIHKDQFQAWISQGRHGAMAYLERNAFKRIDPQEVLRGAQSIIVLAVSYWDPASAGSALAENGTVARYARHADYHDVLAEKLKLLTECVNETGGPETKSLWYVDTGPLLERDLAQRAGLGFAGKHTNLISRELGNWFFIAEIITTLALPGDEPERNRCGSCVRCLEACPTRAITGPFQLDARRCISYLTIELKGSIPEEFRRAIGNRIYGCDACLEVCPWNRFARESSMMRPHRREDLEEPELLRLLALNDEEFRAMFRGTPILRTKRRGLLRNVCVALGNSGTEAVLPALEKATQDHEPLIVEHARWAIEQIRRRNEIAGAN